MAFISSRPAESVVSEVTGLDTMQHVPDAGESALGIALAWAKANPSDYRSKFGSTDAFLRWFAVHNPQLQRIYVDNPCPGGAPLVMFRGLNAGVPVTIPRGNPISHDVYKLDCEEKPAPCAGDAPFPAYTGGPISYHEIVREIVLRPLLVTPLTSLGFPPSLVLNPPKDVCTDLVERGVPVDQLPALCRPQEHRHHSIDEPTFCGVLQGLQSHGIGVERLTNFLCPPSVPRRGK